MNNVGDRFWTHCATDAAAAAAAVVVVVVVVVVTCRD